jgi:hypothetical protein
VSQQTTNRSFDDLARAVAEGSLSRRRALKLFVGTALAALIPSRALADEDCVRVCHVPFDRDTEECDFANARTICVSRRERRRHLENHPCDCRGRCANCLCLPNGDTCMANDDCCSGNCSSGTCAAACLPDCVRNAGCTSFCTSGTQCCSGNCSGGTCRGRNAVRCQCQIGTFSTCTSGDCSDATALNQFCDDVCKDCCGGSAGVGTHVCTTNGCV